MTTSLHHRGFTLVETLVAIALLMIAIVVPFYGVQQALLASYVARDQVVASSLAEEGAEYIYYIRDNNYLYYKQNSSYPGSSGWLSGLDSCTVTINANGCAVDPPVSTITACTSSGCGPLYLNNTTNMYTQTSTGGTVTKFVRTVKITRIGTDEARVTVTVAWNSAHRPYTITVTEDLYNWL